MRQSDRADGQPRTGAASQGRTARPGRRVAIIAVTGAAGLLTAACSSGSPSPTTPAASRSAASASASAAAAELHISPGDGHHNVNPSKGVTVTAAGGTIQNVTVTAGQPAVGGSFNAAHTIWQSPWTLQPSTSYTVHATAVSTSGRRSRPRAASAR